MSETKHICCKCNEELISQKITFEYMGITMNHELPCCPSCGVLFISEELASGKIAEVEMQLEEK